MSYLKVSNITKRFDDKLVLDNVSFDIEKGEIFGLLGPNGAGKSTLINIIIGLLKSNKGQVLIDGISFIEDAVKYKGEFGYVPQDIALMENISAYDNLEFFGRLYNLRGKLLKERIDEALEITGLMERKKDKVKKFSGGMKRRLNIAAAIMHHPNLIILDEPTVGVDPQSRNHILDFIRKVNKERNTTIIYTSHYMEEVEQLCKKIFIMDAGSEIAYGSLENIKNMISGKNKVSIKLSRCNGEILYKLSNMKGVLDVKEEEEEKNLVILKVDDSFEVGNTIKALEENAVKIVSVSFQEATLEEVFLNLTGKSLRD